MKRPLLVPLALVVLAACSFTSFGWAQTLADQTWWHTRLTQAQREALVLKQALTFPDNFNAGVSCKVWVQQMVVPPASMYVAHIPLNNPYCDWMWQWGPDVEIVGQDSWNGSVSWMPGQIIQCQVRTTYGGTSPHTMIVVSANTSGVTVIECNWKGDGCVRRHTADWPTLQRQIIHYTLYRVK